MDLSKFKTSDWLKVGGGAVMLIAGFLTWWQPKCPSGVGSSACESTIDALNLDINAFDLTFTGLFPWILLVAIGVLTFLAVTGIFKLPASMPWPTIFLAAAGFSALMILIRLFADPFDTGLLNDATERGIGMYLAVVAGALSLFGCIKGYTESGGSLSDLKDMNKMKSQFSSGGGSSSAPPPPPPGIPPPPPPR